MGLRLKGRGGLYRSGVAGRLENVYRAVYRFIDLITGMKNRFGYRGRMNFYRYRLMFVQRCHLVNIHEAERQLYVLQEIIPLGYLFYIMDADEPGDGHVGIRLLVFLVMFYQVRNTQ